MPQPPSTQPMHLHGGRLPGGSTLWWALCGVVLRYASLPPIGWSHAVWLAPLPWLWLIHQAELPTRRPYRALWLAGWLYWCVSLEWLRHAYWAAGVGGMFLAAYLGAYLPLFVALARLAVQRHRWPIWLAAPVIWVGLELAQAHLLTGFSLGQWGHALYAQLTLIQCCDLGGAYGLTALVWLVAAGIWETGVRRRAMHLTGLARWRGLTVALITIAMVWGYGSWRLSHEKTRPGPRVALVQGNIATEVKHDPTMRARVLEEYWRLSEQAIQQFPDAQLIVWPETMFRDPVVTWTTDARPVAGETWTVPQLAQWSERSQQRLAQLARHLGRPVVVGVDTYHFGAGTMDLHNSAVLVEPAGSGQARYDKMHPVLFGEYVPLGEWLPWVYRFLPVPQGLTPGRRDITWEVSGARLTPDICYEMLVPQRIRRQVRTMEAQNQRPDLLLNLTNNGYYGGSAELDLHLISGVMRAVELRRPVLIAANTGFSAHIDGSGRIRARGPRQAAGVVYADTQLDARRSHYAAWGDWPAGGCLLVCVALGFSAWRGRRGWPVANSGVPAQR